MTARTLHLTTSLKDSLQSAQADALELACMDCGFSLSEGGTAAELLAFLTSQGQGMAAVSVADLAQWVATGVSLPGERLIVVPTERENPALAAFTEGIVGLRYVVGAPTPSLLRGLFASILGFVAQVPPLGIIERLLQTEGLERETYLVTHSSERSFLQEKALTFFTAQLEKHRGVFVSGTGSFPKNIADVLDEFLMNAIWDACHGRVEQDRTKATALAEGEQVKVEFCCDGANLILAVDDAHGTFPVTSMVKPIRHALGLKPPAQINEGPGGAGLGLYMILQKVSCLAYEVERGKRTRAVAILRGDQSLRELQKRPRSVLFFEKKT